jgi:hypothetical protein
MSGQPSAKSRRTQTQRTAGSEAQVEKTPDQLVESLRQFCAMRVKNLGKVTKFKQNINKLDEHAKEKKQGVFRVLKERQKRGEAANVQVQTPNGPLQARIMVKFEYDIPTLLMIQQLNLDCQRLQRLTPAEAEEYIFLELQQSRRTAKEKVEVKPCGPRNQKVLPCITDADFCKLVNQAHEIGKQSTKERAKKRKIQNNKQTEYIDTLKFMQMSNRTAQTINLRSEDGQPARRVLIRRVDAGKNKSLSGKALKELLNQTMSDLEKLRLENPQQFHQQLAEALMDKIYTHLKETKHSREKITFEIQNC